LLFVAAAAIVVVAAVAVVVGQSQNPKLRPHFEAVHESFAQREPEKKNKEK